MPTIGLLFQKNEDISNLNTYKKRMRKKKKDKEKHKMKYNENGNKDDII